MEVLLPLLTAAAPAATRAFLVGAGGVVGKAAGNAVVDTVGGVADGIGNTINGIKNGIGNTISGVGSAITSFGQPAGQGQQRFYYTATQQPYIY